MHSVIDACVCVCVCGGGSGYEESLAATMARKESRPYWRRAGRDFHIRPRVLQADRFGLSGTYFRALIAD